MIAGNPKTQNLETRIQKPESRVIEIKNDSRNNSLINNVHKIITILGKEICFWPFLLSALTTLTLMEIQFSITLLMCQVST